jgi:hypothetical protein
LFKIGITNFLEQRLTQHRKKGFTMIDTLGPMEGDQARKFERQVLSYLDRICAARVPERLGIFNGYTEAWQAQSLRIENLAELLELAGHRHLNSV